MQSKLRVPFLCKPTTPQFSIETNIFRLQTVVESLISLCCNFLCGSNSLETLKHFFGSFAMGQPQGIKGPTLKQPLGNLGAILEQPLGNLWATSSNLKLTLEQPLGKLGQPRGKFSSVHFGATLRQPQSSLGATSGGSFDLVTILPKSAKGHSLYKQRLHDPQ